MSDEITRLKAEISILEECVDTQKRTIADLDRRLEDTKALLNTLMELAAAVAKWKFVVTCIEKYPHAHGLVYSAAQEVWDLVCEFEKESAGSSAGKEA